MLYNMEKPIAWLKVVLQVPSGLLEKENLINFWNDSWLPNGSLESIIEGPVSFQKENLTTKNLMENNSWQLPKLSVRLPSHVVMLFNLPHSNITLLLKTT